MSYKKWPKRSAEKNYFMVPNEIFSIGLDYREISLYTYLLRCENRETYQCYPSYKTIGKAIGMSENTVAKYVRQLEEKGLIFTKPTIMQSKDGKPLNGNLLYTILPIPGVLEAFYERQFRQAASMTATSSPSSLTIQIGSSGRQRRLPPAIVRQNSSKSPMHRAARTPCVRLSGRKRVPVPAMGLKPDVSHFRQTFAGRKKKQDKGMPPQPSLLPAVRAVSGV